MNITVNNFMRRHTKDSKYSHFEEDESLLVKLVIENFDMKRAGSIEGVIFVPLSPQGFFSEIVGLDRHMSLAGGYQSNMPGKKPRKYLVAPYQFKLPAKSVDIVLHTSCKLSEDNDNELDPVSGNWEIVGIDARPCIQPIPEAPEILMHYYYGPSNTNMGEKEFIETLKICFEFWKDKARAG